MRGPWRGGGWKPRTPSCRGAACCAHRRRGSWPGAGTRAAGRWRAGGPGGGRGPSGPPPYQGHAFMSPLWASASSSLGTASSAAMSHGVGAGAQWDSEGEGLSQAGPSHRHPDTHPVPSRVNPPPQGRQGQAPPSICTPPRGTRGQGTQPRLTQPRGLADLMASRVTAGGLGAPWALRVPGGGPG